MIHAEYTYTLPATPAQVFAYVSNPARDSEWQASCVSAELLGAEPAVGCRYNIVFNFLGRKMHFIGEIVRREPYSECAFKVIEGSFHYEGSYSLRPVADGTEVHWKFAAEPGKFFGILPTSVLRKVLVSQIEKDSVTLAHLLKTAAAVAA